MTGGDRSTRRGAGRLREVTENDRSATGGDRKRHETTGRRQEEAVSNSKRQEARGSRSERVNVKVRKCLWFDLEGFSISIFNPWSFEADG